MSDLHLFTLDGCEPFELIFEPHRVGTVGTVCGDPAQNVMTLRPAGCPAYVRMTTARPFGEIELLRRRIAWLNDELAELLTLVASGVAPDNARVRTFDTRTHMAAALDLLARKPGNNVAADGSNVATLVAEVEAAFLAKADAETIVALGMRIRPINNPSRANPFKRR